MTDEGVYKAEIVYVTDVEDAEHQKMRKNSQTQLKFTDNPTLTPSPTLAMAHDEIICPSPRPGPVTMEPTDKQSYISQQGCHNTFKSAEISPGLFLNHASQREEEVLSPASSVDLFPSITSSKESIMFEGWEQDRSWSALQTLSPGGSPVSFSRTVSPCSSVRSGAFTPSVLRIKRHTLAPGSSLVQMPLSSGQTLCCDCQTPSPCPLSPRARHRPPPTQLSLLTAILRKGRLPILSSALQRPYSPCWPIRPVSMSSCTACSAASNIAPVETTKTCATKGIAFTEPSQKARPMPPRLINSTWSSKEHKVSIPSIPLGTPDTFDFKCSEVNSGIPLPKNGNSLTLPCSSPKPTLGNQSRPGCKDSHVPTLPSSLLISSFSTSRAMSPKSNHESCCRVPSTAEHSEQSHSILDFSRQGHGHKSKYPSFIQKNEEPSLDLKPKQMPCDPSPIPDLTPTLMEANDNPRFYLQNGRKALLDLERVLSASPALKMSPSPRLVGITRLSDTPDISPASPRPSSRSPTPDHYTLSPSPAIHSRQLSPSPSYSLCSSPSPSLRGGTPDCADRGGKNKKPYKIKSTYKTLAAIPTNTLLLEQQAIDDEVEKNEASLDPTDIFAWEDPHSQMCTPAQLRQQSEELYAAIDEVLEDTNPTHESNPANNLAVTPAAAETPRTKPGVIRPLTLTRLDDIKGEEYVPNPFQRYQGTLNFQKYKFAGSLSTAVDEVDRRGDCGGESSHGEMLYSDEPRHSPPNPEQLIAQTLTTERALPLTAGTLQGVPSSLKPVQVKMETPEAPI
ncbi:muscular LMNA-interacting protein [Salminus brasiliensis]|uniref:muscular LMNA-interacting protein n=1 Tax=Salminus brasiliensis TaxID=930266 RepID=UPI003B832D90